MSAVLARVRPLLDGLALPIGLALLTLLVVWHARQLAGFAALGHHDFRILHEATSEFWSGQSLYAARTSNGNLNAPHFHLLLVPFTWLPPAVAFWVWTLTNIGGFAISVRLIVRELSLRLPVVAWIWAANGALLFAGTAAALWSGQTSLLLMWPATLAWLAARRGNWARSGALTGLLIALKPFVALFVPFWIGRHYYRALAMATLVVVGCFGIGLLVFGVDEHRAWIATLREMDWAHEPWNASLLAPFARAGSESVWLDRLWLPGAALLAAAGVVRAVSAEARNDTDQAFACLHVSALLASPLGWVHYLWWGAGPVAATLRADAVAGLQGWRLAALTIAAAGLLSPPAAIALWGNHAIGRTTIGSAYFWGALALWLLLIGRRPWSDAPVRVGAAHGAAASRVRG